MGSHQVARIPEIRIYGHSTIFYWWPAWASGFFMAFLTMDREGVGTAESELVGSPLDFTYVVLLLLLVIFTNVRLRGIYSVVTLITMAFVAVLLGWFGWWPEIIRLLPYLSVSMNSGFYLIFSAALLILWLLMFFIFDRTTYWRIRPGQLTIEHLIGGGAESYDTNGLKLQKLSSDLFRVVLGFGTGDLQVTGVGQAPGRAGETITLPNVLFAQRRVSTIERLISVKPDLVT